MSRRSLPNLSNSIVRWGFKMGVSTDAILLFGMSVKSDTIPEYDEESDEESGLAYLRWSGEPPLHKWRGFSSIFRSKSYLLGFRQNYLAWC